MLVQLFLDNSTFTEYLGFTYPQHTRSDVLIEFY
jgi:hypothetical protein